MPSYRYPGPRPFEENDINLFFGREKDKKNLLTFINVEPLLVLFSKSGLGKSSLINAAIIPELRNKNYEIIVCRFNSYVNKERDESIVAEPQSPLQKLFSETSGKLKIQDSFLDNIITNPEPFSLWHQFKNLQISNSEKKTYFIFFDQFEELFTYPQAQVKEFKEHLAELFNASIPQQYLNQINAIENDTSTADLTDEQLSLLYEPIPVKMLCTIRSDKFSLLTNLKDAIPGIVTKTYELKPFNTAEATEAILKPASLESSAEGGFISNAFTYDDDAIKKMLNYLTDDGTEDIESFQLQVLCRYVEDMVIENKKANNELKNISATQLGDIKNIFEAYYNRLIANLDKDKVNNVKRLFEEGLIFEKDKIRVPLYKGQIADTYGVDEALLQKLVNTHLIRSEADTNGKEKFELSHDSLIEPILKAKEKRVAEEKAALQKINFRKGAISLIKKIVAGGILIFLIALYFVLRNSKKDRLEINFLVSQRDWFYLLDSTQQANAMQYNFLLLANSDSVKYNTLKYSFKCAAYANQNAETNYSLALKFAQEGFLKDSNNSVIKLSFDKLIRKPNVHLPSLTINCRGLVNNTRISEDQSAVVATSTEGIFWYNANNGAVTDSLTDTKYSSDYSVFSSDGQYLLYQSYDSDTAYLINTNTKENKNVKIVDDLQYYPAFAISKHNEFIIYANADTVKVITLDGVLKNKYILPISVNDDITVLSISPDDNRFVVGTSYGEIFLGDLRIANNKRNPSLLTMPDKKNPHYETINAVTFSHNGKYFLTGFSDGKLQIWDSEKTVVLQTMNVPSAISKACFSYNDNEILIGENESGIITQWNKRKQNAGDTTNNNGKLQTDSIKYTKADLQLFGLDSSIASLDLYSNNSKIIASSSNKISLWNLPSNKKFSLQLNNIVAKQIIPKFRISDKIKFNLLTLQDLLTLTQPRDIFHSIKILNDSLANLNAQTNGVKENRQTFIKLCNLIPKLFNNLKMAKTDAYNKLDKLDSFDIYIYTGNSYFYKTLLDKDSLNGNFSKYNFEKLITFRQAPFKLDTMYKKCFDDLFNAYSIGISYYFKNKQYNNALYWNNKVFTDNQQLKNIPEIKNNVTIINQYDVSFRILNKDIQGAKQSFKNWQQTTGNLNYLLTKELMNIYMDDNYSFNKNNFKKALEIFDLKDDGNKQDISDMDAVAFRLLNEKSTRKLSPTVVKNLTAFDNYIYSLNQ